MVSTLILFEGIYSSLVPNFPLIAPPYIIKLFFNSLKKILFCSNEYYGGLWATFNFDGLQKWIEDLKTSKSDSRDSDPKVESGEIFLKASNQYSTVENIEENWYIVE